MRGDTDGIHRQEWLSATVPHGTTTAVRTSPPIVTEAPVERKREEPIPSAETRINEWDEWLERRANEAAEAGGDEEAVSVDPLLVEGLSALQRAVDVALARLERSTEMVAAKAAANAADTIAALRLEVVAFEAARRADQERHRQDVVRLETQSQEEITALRKTLAAIEIAGARDRAHRRLLDAGRAYPFAQRADLERARRKTDRAIKGAAP